MLRMIPNKGRLNLKKIYNVHIYVCNIHICTYVILLNSSSSTVNFNL